MKFVKAPKVQDACMMRGFGAPKAAPYGFYVGPGAMNLRLRSYAATGVRL